MKKRGRPPKLTVEMTDRLCQALSAGNYRTPAAEWAGIAASTFHEWMRRGKAQKVGEYRDFRRRVLEAEKAAEIRAVGLVMAAAKDDARHAEWWLERKFHDRWGRKDTTRLEAGKKPVRIEHSSDTDRTTPIDSTQLTRVMAVLLNAGAMVATDAEPTEPEAVKPE